MKKLIKYILSFVAILTLTSCSEKINQLAEKINQLENSFTNSFCKVEFVCYQNEPNWLGVILLVIFVILIYGLLALIFEVILDWFSD